MIQSIIGGEAAPDSENCPECEYFCGCGGTLETLAVSSGAFAFKAGDILAVEKGMSRVIQIIQDPVRGYFADCGSWCSWNHRLQLRLPVKIPMWLELAALMKRVRRLRPGKFRSDGSLQLL